MTGYQRRPRTAILLLISAVLLVAAALVLAGCGQRVAGPIVEKTYQPGYYVYMPCGKSICPVWWSECYRIVVADGGHTCVARATWAGLKVGDLYDSEAHQ